MSSNSSNTFVAKPDGIHTGYHETPAGKFPSFSTIWFETSNQDALKAWKAENPGVAEEAAWRGTRTHNWAEDYLLSGANSSDRTMPELGEDNADIKGFCYSLMPELFRMGQVVWAEESISDGKPDGKHRCVWHPELKYSGRPDIIAYNESGLCLYDIKTCNFPYYAQLPMEPNYKQQLADKEITWMDIPREIRAGMLKYKKVRSQLLAYAVACEVSLGIKVDSVCALISLPDQCCQSFTIKRDSKEWGWAWKHWLEKLDKYYSSQRKIDQL